MTKSIVRCDTFSLISIVGTATMRAPTSVRPPRNLSGPRSRARQITALATDASNRLIVDTIWPWQLMHPTHAVAARIAPIHFAVMAGSGHPRPFLAEEAQKEPLTPATIPGSSPATGMPLGPSIARNSLVRAWCSMRYHFAPIRSANRCKPVFPPPSCVRKRRWISPVPASQVRAV
jgi:hypothetical protein